MPRHGASDGPESLLPASVLPDSLFRPCAPPGGLERARRRPGSEFACRHSRVGVERISRQAANYCLPKRDFPRRAIFSRLRSAFLRSSNARFQRTAGQQGMSTPARARPSRARDKLQHNFVHALAEDFKQHGVAAIEKLREIDPASYIRVIASLMPKEVGITHRTEPFAQLTDEQLAAVVDATERFLSAAGFAGSEVGTVEALGAPEPGGVH